MKTMNIRAINSQLSTIESEKQTKQNKNNKNRTMDMDIIWRVISWEGKGGKWGKRYRD